jgi:hypothetical protein
MIGRKADEQSIGSLRSADNRGAAINAAQMAGRQTFRLKHALRQPSPFR